MQAEVSRLSGQSGVGWKTATTSVAGQTHIIVDGSLAGRLLADRVFVAGTEAAPFAARPELTEVRHAAAGCR